MIRVILALLLVIAGAVVPQTAHAQQGSQECDDFEDWCDEGRAYQVALASANEVGPFLCRPSVNYPNMSYYGPKLTPSYSQSGNSFSVAVNCRSGNTLYVAIPKYFMHYFIYMCSQRATEFNWKGGPTAGSVNVCYEGCMYRSSLDVEAPSGHAYDPTGSTCGAGDAPEPVPVDEEEEEEEEECDEGEKEVGGICVPEEGGGTNPGEGGGTDPGEGGTDPGEGGTDPGTPGDWGGPLYTQEYSTGDVGEVLNKFKDRVAKSDIFKATTGFFVINVGGACPVFELAASDYWQAMTLDVHCGGEFAEMLSLMGWVLLSIAAYQAAKIALM
ncbi:hypothetical protein [Stenotrophomonas sp.]|uniref:hypothetical protein n=1 Tax=Stenotrophomonas sp. TaxID=69392 RepID=UPI002FC9BCA1